MRVHFDPEINALYVRFSDSPVHETEEVQPGVMFDYDTEGRIVGMEVLDVTRNLAPANFQEFSMIEREAAPPR
jgi:uncharacterized protein YuzE